MSIPERQFPLYETVILTEQMPAHRVPEFLEENPEFKTWYVVRRDKSRQSIDAAQKNSSICADVQP